MSMFSMFLETPPSSEPVNLIYQEKLAFGPFGQAAGEISPTSGFSEVLWLEVEQNALDKYRTLRVVCDGIIRVLGVQKGFSTTDATSPLVVALTPAPKEMRELQRLCSANQIETPRRIIYHGVDPSSLFVALGDYFSRISSIRILDKTTNRLLAPDLSVLMAEFLAGNLQIPIIEARLGAGLALGTVSDKNLAGGYFKFGIEIRTTPPFVPSLVDPFPSDNYLDPVVLFKMLASAKLSNGNDAINPIETKNSWLDNVTRYRVLITFRDEWNAALVSPTLNAIVQGPAAGQTLVMRLDEGQVGTIVAPSVWGQYTSQIGVPSQRKLTPIPSDQAASDPLTITASAPAHRVVGSVRPEDWFHPSDPPCPPHKSLQGDVYNFDLPIYTTGNQVDPLIDGFAYFGQLVKEIQDVSSADHFIILIGWRVEGDFNMLKGVNGTSLKELLTTASARGATILAMFWDATGSSDNTAEVDFIEQLPTGQAVLDASHPWFGAHHAKYVIVRNTRGTFAFVGGIDLASNRLDGPDHLPTNTRYHDIHSRIVGPAVGDVTKTFIDRWMDYRYIDPVHIEDSLDQFFSIDGTAPELKPVKPSVGSPVVASHFVQIAQTYGRNYMSFSPGVRTIWATFKQAIQRARRYIYIEDQYLVAPMLRDELLAVLSFPLVEVIFVIAEQCEDFRVIADQDAYDRARYIFLKDLIYHPRVHVFYARDYFIHAKVRIIDDIFATIGSANANRRGLTHDNELNAFILDGRVDAGMRKFALDLRTQLWAEHLGMPLTQASFSKLENIDDAIELLTQGTKPSRLVTYNLKKPGSDYTFGWDTFVDPDGS